MRNLFSVVAGGAALVSETAGKTGATTAGGGAVSVPAKAGEDDISISAVTAEVSKRYMATSFILKLYPGRNIVFLGANGKQFDKLPVELLAVSATDWIAINLCK